MKTIKEVGYRIVQFDRIGELWEFLAQGGTAKYYETGELKGTGVPLVINLARVCFNDKYGMWVTTTDLKKIYGKIEI